MEKFIVSARKYRPQNFNSVVGQEHITTTLKNAIKNNQLAHAFLFCGPRGVGKTTCARILGKTINCENRTPDGEACNQCQSCVNFDKGTSLNIHELDAASNNSVDDIRALVDQVRFAPQGGKYKVYIVDEVHMLSAAAFNAFLKTLEEPPPFAIFILATTEKHKIIPTILSRCQIFDFKRIKNQDTAIHLKEIGEKEGIHTEDAALHILAQKSEGCLRDALSLFDKIVSFTNGQVTYANTLEHLNILDEDYYFKVLDALIAQKLSDALLIFDEIDRKGFEGNTFLEGFAEFLRNLMVSKDVKVASLLEVPEDFKPRYAAKATKVDYSWIISAINILGDAIVQLRQAQNKKLHIELVLIRLSYLGQVIEFSSEGGVKKKLTDKAKSISFRNIIAQPVQGVALKAAPVVSKEKPKDRQPVSARLTVEEPLPVIKKENPASTTRMGKLSTLEDIRKVIANNNKAQSATELSEEGLRTAWNLYIQKLEKENLSSAITAFSEARICLKGDWKVEVTPHNEFHLNLIEGEKRELTRFFQSHFGSRSITFLVKKITEEASSSSDQAFMTSKERYQYLIERFPQVKTLKDGLGLKLEL